MEILRKRGVAWIITLVVIVAAIGIGQAKKPSERVPDRIPERVPGSSEVDRGQMTGGYVYDEADVLSDATEQALEQRNAELWADRNAVIAVVTCNYNKSDLGGYALEYGDSIGLGENDMIVVLDISGDNYWLVQGAGLTDDFTDDDCTAYAWNYMESDFARGDYDSAVLSLTEALAAWYETGNEKEAVQWKS